LLTTTHINKSLTEVGDRMTQIEPDSVTAEEAELLYALVRMRKPELVIETGTGHLQATIPMTKALRMNGTGLLLTCDTDADYALEAQIRHPSIFCRITHGTGLELLKSLDRKADFIFVDAGNADNRMEEVRYIVENDVLAPKGILVIHDTINPKYRKLEEYVRAQGWQGLSLDSIGGIGFFQR
jgi:predicted O-methyltransferase YrrM